MVEWYPEWSAPVYWQARLGEPVTLYEGTTVIGSSGDARTVDTSFRFEWLPMPSVRFYTAYVDEGADVPSVPPEALIRQVIQPQWIPENGTYTSRYPATTAVGAEPDRPVSAVLFNLVNFWSCTQQERLLRHDLVPVSFEARDSVWRISVDPTPDHFEVARYLGQTHLYAFTHTAKLQRVDGKEFTWADCELMRDELFVYFALARGSLVGLALPVGEDAHGVPQWARWECTKADRGARATSWCSPTNHGALSRVLPGLSKRYENEFWRDVLRRVIRYYVEANAGRASDIMIPNAQTGLEILSWAMLQEESPAPKFNYSHERVRWMLTKAKIPTAIPRSLESLTGKPAGAKEEPWDGPSVLTHVRNTLIHVPKTEVWPDSKTLSDALLLGVSYLELMTLYVAGYSGPYASRIRGWGLRGRVPWDDGSSILGDESGD